MPVLQKKLNTEISMTVKEKFAKYILYMQPYLFFLNKI